MQTSSTSFTARAKTALIGRQGGKAQAFISVISATARESAAAGQRLCFAGGVEIDEKAREHASGTILLLVDRILERLGVPRHDFELEVANLAAASVAEIPLHISGNSADVPFFLAMLASALNIEIGDKVLSTGHIDSSDGDLRPVWGLPEKIAAAQADSSIRTFIYPVPNCDTSLAALLPRERERIEAAISGVRDTLRLCPVCDIAQVITLTLDEEAIALSSLNKGFFSTAELSPVHDISAGTAANRAVRFLADGNESRFWRSLERRLFAKEFGAAKKLLSARAQYHIARKEYPGGFGGRLLQMTLSLPPTVRRLEGVFPLLPRKECARLGLFANDADDEDVDRLSNAVLGRSPGRAVTSDRESSSHCPPTEQIADPLSAELDAVLAEIDEKSLGEKLGLSFDAARAGYILDAVTVDSKEEFEDLVAAFYQHLLRRCGSALAFPASEAIRAEAVDLVSRAFSRRGGLPAALAEARLAIHGGTRMVLDAMTEQIKNESYEKHVAAVLTMAVDTLDWDQRVAFAGSFLKRIGPALPPDCRAMPPDQIAGHLGALARAYVQSLDRFNELIRRL